MTPKERRERERQEVRAKLLEAARAEFVERGFEAATTRRIAERAGYTTGAVFFHFKDKETMLRELCDADFRALREAFGGQVARIADPRERLKAIGRAYLEFAGAYPNHYRLMFMTPHPDQDPEGSAIERGNPEEDAYAFCRDAVSGAMGEGAFRPEFTDPDLIAQVLWSGIHGIAALSLTKGQDPWIPWRPLGDRAEVLLEALLRGLMDERC
jgi:AcrR family transcriptional regulator